MGDRVYNLSRVTLVYFSENAQKGEARLNATPPNHRAYEQMDLGATFPNLTVHNSNLYQSLFLAIYTVLSHQSVKSSTSTLLF